MALLTEIISKVNDLFDGESPMSAATVPARGVKTSESWTLFVRADQSPTCGSVTEQRSRVFWVCKTTVSSCPKKEPGPVRRSPHSSTEYLRQWIRGAFQSRHLGTMATTSSHPASLPGRAFRRYSSKVGAVCGNPARTDLCGGRSAMIAPTATRKPRVGECRSGVLATEEARAETR
jgi:hypothetical protein